MLILYYVTIIYLYRAYHYNHPIINSFSSLQNISINIKISNIKCKHLHSILKPKLNKDNEIFFAILIIINKVEHELLVGIGLNPTFFSKLSRDINDIPFSELKNTLIEIYIFELNNMNSIQIGKNNSFSHRNLDYLCKRAKFYAGIKLDLLSLLLGSENYDFPLTTIIQPEHKLPQQQNNNNECYTTTSNDSRISFKIKCEETKQYVIKVKNINIKYNSNNNINGIPDNINLQMNLTRINNLNYSNIIKLTHNKSNQTFTSDKNTELIINSSNLTIEELYNATINLHGFDKNNFTCAYFSLTKYKEQILYELMKQYVEYINNINTNENIEEYNAVSIGKKEIKDLIFIICNKIDCLISAEFSIENYPLFIQMKNVYLTEKGIVNDISHLYYETLLLGSYNDNEDISYTNQYKILTNVYKQLQTINETTSSKNDVITKYANDLKDNISKSADKEYYIYKYKDNCQLITIADLFVKIISELNRLLIIYKSEEKSLMLILDMIKLIIQRDELNIYLLNEINTNSEYDCSFIERLLKECIDFSNKVPDILTNESVVNLVEIFGKLFYKFKQTQQYLLNAFQQDTSLPSNHELHSIQHYYSLVNSFPNVNETVSNIETKLKNLDSYKRNCLCLQIMKNILEQFNSKISFPFTSLTVFPMNILTHDYISYISQDKSALHLFSGFLIDITSCYLNDATALNTILHCFLSKTNAYNGRSVYEMFEFVFQILANNFLKNFHSHSKIDYTLLQLAINGIIAVDNGLCITKIFWLYYGLGHIMDIVHIRWFMCNFVKKYFFMFAFHWSWKVRFMFNKFIVYIVNHRLKAFMLSNFISEHISVLERENEKEIKGKLNKVKEMFGFDNFCFIDQEIKEYNEVKKEFEKWLIDNKKKAVEDYPIVKFFLPKEEDIA